MLSTLLKLVVLYYVVKFVIDRLIPYFKGDPAKDGGNKGEKIKRFEDDSKQVKEAEFDEL